jgi:hypothetical protein
MRKAALWVQALALALFVGATTLTPNDQALAQSSEDTSAHDEHTDAPDSSETEAQSSEPANQADSANAASDSNATPPADQAPADQPPANQQDDADQTTRSSDDPAQTSASDQPGATQGERPEGSVLAQPQGSGSPPPPLSGQQGQPSQPPQQQPGQQQPGQQQPGQQQPGQQQPGQQQPGQQQPGQQQPGQQQPDAQANTQQPQPPQQPQAQSNQQQQFNSQQVNQQNFDQLGIQLQQSNQPAGRGLAISSIQPSSVFFNSGLRQGDVLLSIDNRPLLSQAEFVEVISNFRGDRIPLAVLRDGRQQTIFINRPANFGVATLPQQSQPLHTLLGVIFDPQITNAAVVRTVIVDSPAAQAGLQSGDLITALNGQPVASPQHATQLIGSFAPGQQIMIDYSRQQMNLSTQAVLSPRQQRIDYSVGYPPERTVQRIVPAPAPERVWVPDNPRRVDYYYEARPVRPWARRYRVR